MRWRSGGQWTDISRTLVPHRICAFASPAYLAERGAPKSPDDLVHHDCVNFRYQSSGQALRWPFQAGNPTVELAPDAGIVADVSEAVAAVLVAGGGIGISPTYVATSYVRRGELVPVIAEYALDRFRITALWPEGRRSNPNVRVFTDFLTELFPSPTPWDVGVQRALDRADEDQRPRSKAPRQESVRALVRRYGVQPHPSGSSAHIGVQYSSLSGEDQERMT